MKILPLKNLLASLLCLACFMLIVSCSKDQKEELITIEQIQMDRLWSELDIEDVRTSVSVRSHGYLAKAMGRGVIPSGEYAGQRFTIGISGLYSALGNGTLISGEAQVKIRGDKFTSIADPLLQSFCCGEGSLILQDGEYEFTVFGQVEHTTAAGLHNHLFASSASTARRMTMNIEDQDGSVVVPASPPHNPGIGLLLDLRANRVNVEEH